MSSLFASSAATPSRISPPSAAAKSYVAGPPTADGGKASIVKGSLSEQSDAASAGRGPLLAEIDVRLSRPATQATPYSAESRQLKFFRAGMRLGGFLGGGAAAATCAYEGALTYAGRPCWLDPCGLPRPDLGLAAIAFGLVIGFGTGSAIGKAAGAVVSLPIAMLLYRHGA